VTGVGGGDREPPRGALTDAQFERERRRTEFALAQRGSHPFDGPVVRRHAGRLRRLGRLLAAVALVACLAAGIAVAARTAPKLQHTRIAATRTPVPGSRSVTLGARKYVVYYEAGTTGNIGLAQPHGISVRVESASHGPLPLRPYTGNFHTGSAKVDARAFETVQVPGSGRYTIVASGRSSQPIVARSPRIVLGEPSGGRIPLLVGAGVLALLAFIGLCFIVPGLLRGR
jgi:hypothetical protein